MKIVFDGFWWTSGTPSLRHVQRELLFTWLLQYPRDEVAVVVRRKHFDEARRELPSTVLIETTALWPQALVAGYVLERVRKRLGYDVLLGHNYAGRSKGASLVFLHDLLFVDYPQWFTRKERFYYSFMVRWLSRADLVLVSSDSESRRVRSHFPSTRIRRVGIGLSRELTHGETQSPTNLLVTNSFILCVGRLNARKNLAMTIEALLDANVVSQEVPLVVVGERDGKSEGLSVGANDAVESGAIVFLGHVSEPELRWLYSHARLFVFLSLGEGFGMPPVEAWAFGAPLLVSDLAVNRENLGSSAVYVDPNDRAEISRQAQLALAKGRHASSGSAAFELHNWEKTVREVRRAAEDALEWPATDWVQS